MVNRNRSTYLNVKTDRFRASQGKERGELVSIFRNLNAVGGGKVSGPRIIWWLDWRINYLGLMFLETMSFKSWRDYQVTDWMCFIVPFHIKFEVACHDSTEQRPIIRPTPKKEMTIAVAIPISPTQKSTVAQNPPHPISDSSKSVIGQRTAGKRPLIQ